MELGWSHSQVQAMPYEEYVRFQSYFAWRAKQRQHAQDVAEMRAARR